MKRTLVVWSLALSTLLSACMSNLALTETEKNSLGALAIKAETGNAYAQFQIAERFDFADGVDKDYKKAAHWYLKSAMNNYGAAQCRIAGRYESGLGINKNSSEAYKWSWLCKKSHESSESAKRHADIYMRTMLSVGILTIDEIKSLEEGAQKWENDFSSKGIN